MGFIRKAISGTAAVATGGLSLGVIQFRSDTERAAHQTKKLRRAIEEQNGVESGAQAYVAGPTYVHVASQGQASTGFSGLAPEQNLAVVLPSSGPSDQTPGWKVDPDTPGVERFWNGRSWTSKTRAILA